MSILLSLCCPLRMLISESCKSSKRGYRHTSMVVNSEQRLAKHSAAIFRLPSLPFKNNCTTSHFCFLYWSSPNIFKFKVSVPRGTRFLPHVVCHVMTFSIKLSDSLEILTQKQYILCWQTRTQNITQKQLEQVNLFNNEQNIYMHKASQGIMLTLWSFNSLSHAH